MDCAKEIRVRVPASELLSFYGMKIDRAGFCNCPFHQGDKTGSLKVYSGSRGWHCFGCGAGSSVIDFVMLYFGLTFMDAQRKINEDFRLRLPLDRDLSDQEKIEAAQKAREQKEQAREWEKKRIALQDAVDRALTAYVLLDKWLLRHEPTGLMVARMNAAWYNYMEAEAALENFLSTRYCKSL